MSAFRGVAGERQTDLDRQAMLMVLKSLPPGAARIRLTFECTDAGCGWRREQVVNLKDRQAPQAFEDNVREARLHEAANGVRHQINMTPEPLTS